jgi:hypothetical protein
MTVFYYRRGLKGEAWPVKSLEKPNSLPSEIFTKDKESVRIQVITRCARHEVSVGEDPWLSSIR